MLNNIVKYRQAPDKPYRFSILIPSWNNLDYLKLCIGSLKKNSTLDVQIIVLVNEGRDGTLEWLEAQGDIDYIHAPENIGICYGLNSCRSMVRAEYILYVNDDMYLLPGWDLELNREIERIGHREFMLSATMIEPHDTGNPCVVVGDFGHNLESFDEERLLREYAGMSIPDWNGSTWPPNVMHVDLWDLVGGLSIEFSPGMYSDPDFSRKLWAAGVRLFKGKGSSLVYHFGSKSTGRVRRNKGKKTFVLKWGITSNTFTRQYLQMGRPYEGPLQAPSDSFSDRLVNRIKRLLASW